MVIVIIVYSIIAYKCTMMVEIIVYYIIAHKCTMVVVIIVYYIIAYKNTTVVIIIEHYIIKYKRMHGGTVTNPYNTLKLNQIEFVIINLCPMYKLNHLNWVRLIVNKQGKVAEFPIRRAGYRFSL